MNPIDNIDVEEISKRVNSFFERDPQMSNVFLEIQQINAELIFLGYLGMLYKKTPVN